MDKAAPASSAVEMSALPLLKWAGGKRHIAAEIASRFPANWRQGRYWEPFAGGAAMLLYLQPDDSCLSDVNVRLMDFYGHVKANPEGLFNEISNLSEAFDDSDEPARAAWYYERRNEFNMLPSSLQRSALFYVLNKLCFNGLYRENAAGNFNVPFGQKKRFPPQRYADFANVASKLQSTELHVGSFMDLHGRVNKGDIVYCDPPYIPLEDAPSFTTYHSSGFGLEMQRDLATMMREFAGLGVRVVASNSSTSLTHQVFEGLRIETIRAPRMVSASGAGRGEVEEVVICNFPL